jgi:hypothetical protein
VVAGGSFGAAGSGVGAGAGVLAAGLEGAGVGCEVVTGVDEVVPPVDGCEVVDPVDVLPAGGVVVDGAEPAGEEGVCEDLVGATTWRVPVLLLDVAGTTVVRAGEAARRLDACCGAGAGRTAACAATVACVRGFATTGRGASRDSELPTAGSSCANAAVRSTTDEASRYTPPGRGSVNPVAARSGTGSAKATASIALCHRPVGATRRTGAETSQVSAWRMDSVFGPRGRRFSP